jgi:signal transduction histidine kinase
MATPDSHPDASPTRRLTLRITPARRHTRRRQSPQDAAAQAESLKDQFLSMVSHELRTPVSVILSSANILSFQYGSYISAGQRKHIDKITRASQRLMGLLADLLDATQIQAGTFHLHRRPVSLTAVVDDAIESIEHTAAGCLQRITRHVASDLPDIPADPDRLVQVLSNLLHNASKFTPTGGTIDVSLQANGADVRFSVQDSGPGIAPEHQHRLFQRFSQLGEPLHPEGRSMGLGLFIGKALIEAHGGRIGVDSRPGEGSCFWFTLPMLPISDASHNVTDAPNNQDT